MKARLGGVLGVALVFATVAAGIGRGADALPRPALIVDVNGDISVLRSGATKMTPGTIGMELFTGDEVTSSAACELTLFDEGGGTVTHALKPDAPFKLGQAAESPQGLASGLASSLKDLFGGRAAAQDNDREVGAVQAGMELARLDATRSAPTTRSSSSLSRNAPTERENWKGQDRGNVVAPSPQTLAPGGGAGSGAPASPMVSPASQPPMQRAPDLQSMPDAGGPSDRLATDPTPLPSPPGGGGGRERPAGKEQKTVPRLGGRFRRPAPGKPDTLQDEEPRAESAEGSNEPVPLEHLFEGIEALALTAPLARARLGKIEGTLPALAAVAAAGAAVLRTAGGRNIKSLDETLIDGTRLQAIVQPQGQEPWELEFTIVRDSDFALLRSDVERLIASKVPNAGVVAARLLHLRGYVFAAYALEQRALTSLLKAGRPEKALWALRLATGRHAMLLGDWDTVANTQKRLSLKYR